MVSYVVCVFGIDLILRFGYVFVELDLLFG